VFVFFASASAPPLRVALLGTGIFATNCHLPTIQKLSPTLFNLVAVWSRSEESVDKFLLLLNAAAEENKNENKNSDTNKNAAADDDGTTTRTTEIKGYFGEDGLKEIFLTTSIDAVIIALPINVQPRIIKIAFIAGKHVLSEKPIASTVDEAKQLCDLYYNCNTKYSKTLQWSVAENFRYEPAIISVANSIQNNNDIGYVIAASCSLCCAVIARLMKATDVIQYGADK
jgi:predicted dehydrogenase